MHPTSHLKIIAIDERVVFRQVLLTKNFALSGKIAFEENSVIRGKCITTATVSRIFWKLGESTPYTRMYRKKLVKTLSFTTYSKVIEIRKYLTFL